MERKNRKPGAIILGGHYASLGAARNLAKYRVPVCIVDHEVCISQFSRSVKRYFRCPHPKDEANYVRFLQRIAEDMNLDGCVLFPTTDEDVRILSKYHDPLSEYFHVTTPEWEVIKYLYDKRLTHYLALEQDIPVPKTCNPNSINDLSALDIEFPLVLKPAISMHLSSVTKKKAYRANNMEELIAIYQTMGAIIDPSEILVQELIPGRSDNLYSYFGFFKHGKPIAGYAAKRPRQHPMEFGRASTFAMTINLPELEMLAMRYLSAINYSGLAEVEFMYSPKHARFELLEVNARIWGWHTLAICAGVDLPYLAYADALGEKVPIRPFQEGVKWIRLTTDVLTAAIEIWHGRLTIGEYLRSIRGSKDAVLSLSDPFPFIMELILIPYFAKQRGF